MTTMVLSPVEVEDPADAEEARHASAGRVRFLKVPDQRFLVIDGRGAPGEMPFREAMAALYPVAYTLHFALRRRDVAAPIGVLEGLYWVQPDDPLPVDIIGTPAWRPEDWHWRLMLPVPPQTTPEEILAAIAEVAGHKAPPALGLLRIEPFVEGLAPQILHIGPYDAEAPTIRRLHEAIRSAGLRAHGCHHEIYISDPNRTAPQNVRTVIRQPVEP